MQVNITNAVVLEAITTSRKNFNNDQPVDKQFMDDESYAEALVNFSLRQQLSIREEMGAQGTETLADQLNRFRKGGLQSGANTRKDELRAGQQNSGGGTSAEDKLAEQQKPPVRPATPIGGNQTDRKS